MQLIKLDDLTGHDVYEFCYANNSPNQWNSDSLYLSLEDFSTLSPYLDIVFPSYHYYGPQKITLHEWEKIKEIFLSSPDKDSSILKFFIEINNWLKKQNPSSDYFWIFGV